MKKLTITLATALLMAAPAVAQKAVVDEAEKAVKGFTPDFEAAMNKIKPALENEETKGDVRAWYVAGKAGFGYYDAKQQDKLLGKPVDARKMADMLIDGYNCYIKALPLDSIPEVEKDGTPKVDKKTGLQKYKTKYSKDIVSQLSGHMADYQNAGSTYWEAKEWNKAYNAWGAYIASCKYLGKNAPADTIQGQTLYFQALAAWQGENFDEAIRCFDNARAKGYTKKEVYDYEMSCLASKGGQDAAIIALAKEAYEKYSKEDNRYISLIINDMINKEQYNEALAKLDEAIAKNPTNAEFYNVKGTLYEQKGDKEKALELFKQAIQVDPKYGKSYFDAGRMVYNNAVAEIEKFDKNLSPAKYQAKVKAEIFPIYKEAREYFQQAVDNGYDDAERALDRVKYNLGEE